MIEDRIRKGIAMLSQISPTKWSPVHTTWAHRLHAMVLEHLKNCNLEMPEEDDVIEKAKKIFNRELSSK